MHKCGKKFQQDTLAKMFHAQSLKKCEICLLLKFFWRYKEMFSFDHPEDGAHIKRQCENGIK